jgi:hypothetical protein
MIYGYHLSARVAKIHQIHALFISIKSPLLKEFLSRLSIILGRNDVSKNGKRANNTSLTP